VPKSFRAISAGCLQCGEVNVMKVWIDQDLCTGDGLCTDHAPAVFTLLEDGIAYVKERGRVLNDPGSSGSLAAVPHALEHEVVAAADDCPGECIFIEVLSPVPVREVASGA
jgi:ferredoxin